MKITQEIFDRFSLVTREFFEDTGIKIGSSGPGYDDIDADDVFVVYEEGDLDYGTGVITHEGCYLLKTPINSGSIDTDGVFSFHQPDFDHSDHNNDDITNVWIDINLWLKKNKERVDKIVEEIKAEFKHLPLPSIGECDVPF